MTTIFFTDFTNICFLPGHSTVYQLIQTYDDCILKTIDDQEGKISCVVSVVCLKPSIENETDDCYLNFKLMTYMENYLNRVIVN